MMVIKKLIDSLKLFLLDVVDAEENSVKLHELEHNARLALRDIELWEAGKLEPKPLLEVRGGEFRVEEGGHYRGYAYFKGGSLIVSNCKRMLGKKLEVDLVVREKGGDK